MPLVYKSETIGQVDTGYTTIDDALLNKFAAEGWRLHSVVAGQAYNHPTHGQLPGAVVGIFERQKDGGA